MNHRRVVVSAIGLCVACLMVVSGCIVMPQPTSESSPTPTVTPSPIPATPEPTPVPEPIPAPAPVPTQANNTTHGELSFHLSSHAGFGDTDNYATYSLPLHLTRGQVLKLEFGAVGGNVLVSISSPDLETWGYDGSAILVAGRAKAANDGEFQFAPSEDGDYEVSVKSASPVAEIDVDLEYEISH